MISLIIPTRCEQENIEELLTRLEAVRQRLEEPLEALVVDDPSTDGTAAAAQGFFSRHQFGRVIEQTGARGLAAAVVQGMAEARGDLIGVMDADLSHPPELLPALVQAVRTGAADIAVASRYVPGGGIADWSWHRRALSRLGNLAARPLTSVRDATSGYFVCRTEAARSRLQAPSGFKILVEILARSRGARVLEMPYVFTDRRRGVSKLGLRALRAYALQLTTLAIARLGPRQRGPSGPPQDVLTPPLQRDLEQKNHSTSLAAKALRVTAPSLTVRQLHARLLWHPVWLFFRSYGLRGGFRQGADGFIKSALPAWEEFLTWAKWWELSLHASTPDAAQGSRLKAQGKRQPSPPHIGAGPPRRVAEAFSLQPRETLTVVILTKNEEDKIARCLSSVQWADEIIVVDGESTDRTVEICRSFGATVITHQFSGSFAAERNLGMERAQTDWVLQIDADDVVTPEFRQAADAVLRGSSPHAAYQFYRRSVLLGRVMRHGGWYYTVPNLVRRDRVRYEGLVHERPAVDGTIGALHADIEHHPCEDLTTFIARHNRYTTLQAQELRRTRGALTPREIHRYLWKRPRKTFWKSYVKKRGYREELHGLVFAELFAGVELLKWAKYWQLAQQADEAQVQPSAFNLEQTSV